MDVTEAVSQDQVADSLVAPIDHGEGAEATAGTEDQSQPEVEQEQPVEQTEGEEQQDDSAYLPSEQEKEFPFDVLARYAQGRHGIQPDQLQQLIESQPWIADSLKDQINKDIYVQQLQNQQEFEPEPEIEQPQERTTHLQPLPFQQWRQSAQQLATQITSPEMADAFSQELQACTTPYGKVDAGKLASTFTVFGMNLINSLLPLYFQAPSVQEGKNMFQYFAESQYEGLGDMAQASAYRSAWNSIASKSEGLPQYGTPEFAEMMQKAEDALPGLQWMTFADKNGKPLSTKANAERQYQIAARIAQGQKPNLDLIKQAVQTGKRLARETQVRKQAGNLGAGTSKQQFSQQSDDEFWSNPASWSNYIDRKL